MGRARLTNADIDNHFIKNKIPIKRLDEYENSGVIMKWQCLVCNHIWPTRSRDIYNRGTGCPKCVGCARITNEEIDNRLIGRNIVRLEDVKTVNIPIKFSCMVCDHIWPAKPNHVTTGNLSGCPQCNGHERITSEVVDFRLNAKNRMIKRVDEVTSSTDTINWQCLVCDHVWPASVPCVMIKNTDCPKCANVLRLTNEQVDFRIKNINIKRTEDHVNIRRIVNWHCLICKQDFPASANYLFSTMSCPFCHKSFGEKTASAILFENKINNIKQYKIYDNNRKYFIDFFLPEYNLFIEYNGRQHYEKMNYHNFDFAAQQQRDREVREYCIKNNIHLFEIDSRIYENLQYTDKIKFKYVLQENILNYIVSLDYIGIIKENKITIEDDLFWDI